MTERGAGRDGVVARVRVVVVAVGRMSHADLAKHIVMRHQNIRLNASHLYRSVEPFDVLRELHEADHRRNRQIGHEHARPGAELAG